MSLATAARDPNWIGCIDFGTALSKICLVRAVERAELQQGDIKPLAIAIRPEIQPSNPFLVPSVVFLNDETLLLGEDAAATALRVEGSGREAFVSPKETLSTGEIEQLDLPPKKEIDPSAMFSRKELLKLYMAHLLERAGDNAARQGLPWPVPLRIARPAWNQERAQHGEEVLKELVIHGFMLVDLLGAQLSKKGGLPKSEAKAALDKLPTQPAPDQNEIFKLTDQSVASVKEATAVAAGSIQPTGRRIVAIADIGGGTSDFGAFMTGLRDNDVIAEIEGSSRVLSKAGGFLDMRLANYILTKAGYVSGDPAAQGHESGLRSRSRTNKEILFSQEQLVVELGEQPVLVDLQEFLKDEHVSGFSAQLRDQFEGTLSAAVECAKQHSPRHGNPIPIEILLTGGGYDLPMARELLKNPPVAWTCVAATPQLAIDSDDEDFLSVIRQMLVAIGGAMRDLPLETAPVRNPK